MTGEIAPAETFGDKFWDFMSWQNDAYEEPYKLTAGLAGIASGVAGHYTFQHGFLFEETHEYQAAQPELAELEADIQSVSSIKTQIGTDISPVTSSQLDALSNAKADSVAQIELRLTDDPHTTLENIADPTFTIAVGISGLYLSGRLLIKGATRNRDKRTIR